jgi:hypothetical protein
MTGNTYTPYLTASTTYYAQARYTATADCESASRTAVTATVAAELFMPTITTSSFTVCQNTNVVFRVPANPNITYTWSGTAGTVSGMGNCSYTVSGAELGYKSVTVYATNNLNCQSGTSNIATVDVMALPATPEIMLLSADTVCQNTNVLFLVNQPEDNLTYMWGGTAGTAGGTGNSMLTVSGATTGTKSVTVYALLAYDGVTCRSATSGAVSGFVAEIPSVPTVQRVSAATVCQGTSVMFVASGGGSGVSYMWDGSTPGTASGTNGASYTVSGAETGTKSGKAMASWSGSLCPSQPSSAATATVRTSPSNPTVESASRCGTGTVALLASSPDAVIDWYTSPSGGTSFMTGNTYTTPSLTASATYYAQARNTTTGCLSASRMPVTATVSGAPSVTLISGSSNQTVNSGTPIGMINYRAYNSTPHWSGTLPDGVATSSDNTDLYIHGTPSSTGTFDYMVSSSHTYGCGSSSTLTGTITVITATYTVTGGPNTAHSPRTWIIGSQTWTDRIVGPPECNIGTFTSENYIPHCRSYNDGGTLRYYYNWPYVNANQSTMCPSPWRVPTPSDFDTLVSATDAATLINAWGYGGYAFIDGMWFAGVQACYWSSMQVENRQFAYYLYYDSDSQNATTLSNMGKYQGMQVRCVKD